MEHPIGTYEFEVRVVHTHGVSALPQSGPVDETVTASVGWETGPQRAGDMATHPPVADPPLMSVLVIIEHATRRGAPPTGGVGGGSSAE